MRHSNTFLAPFTPADTLPNAGKNLQFPTVSNRTQCTDPLLAQMTESAQTTDQLICAPSLPLDRQCSDELENKQAAGAKLEKPELLSQ